MSSRLKLSEQLRSILGSSNVYFQPPETIKINYPAIIYSRDKMRTIYADNNPYRIKKAYTLTVIDKDPDSEIPDKIAQLPMCYFNKHFTANNLNHDVFTIYF